MPNDGPVRQGEVLLIPISRVEGELGDPIAREDSRLVLGHSESGHHHVIREPGAELRRPRTECSFYVGDELFEVSPGGTDLAVLTVTKPANLVHEATTGHEPHPLALGLYLRVRQRERSFVDIDAYRPVSD